MRPDASHSPTYSNSPIRIQSWKYAWGENANGGPPSRRPHVPVGAGARASDRLYSSAKSARAAKEALKREVGGFDQLNPPTHHPQTNARSAQLAAGRYAKVMSAQAAGRFRKDAIAIARAKGEPEREESVYNYGDMLYQEAQMASQRRDVWRRQQLQQRQAEEAETLTFQPNLNLTSSATAGGGGFASSASSSVFGGASAADRDEHGGSECADPAAMLERMARRDEESRQRKLALREILIAEEAREFTFKPKARNRVSQALTEGYGDVLTEMHAREEERNRRVRALRERQEALDRGAASRQPDISRSQMSFGWGKPAARAEGGGAAADGADGVDGAADAAAEAATDGAKPPSLPFHLRLYSTHTSAYHQGLLPPETSDPECTFQPNLHRGAPPRAPRQVRSAARPPSPPSHSPSHSHPCTARLHSSHPPQHSLLANAERARRFERMDAGPRGGWRRPVQGRSEPLHPAGDARGASRGGAARATQPAQDIEGVRPPRLPPPRARGARDLRRPREDGHRPHV